MSYIKPIPLEDLPYTPVELGEMLENDEKEREIEVEGYGKGRLVISKQNKNKPFFYADEANIPANQKAAKQLQVAETAFNAPLLLSPVLGLASGIPKIAKDRTRAQIKKARMSADESNLEGAINLKQTVDGVFNMPSQQVRDIVRIAKKNKISYKQAEEYLNLKLRGTEPTGTLNPGSSVETLTKRFMKSPKDRFPGADDIKGQEQPRPKLPPKVTTNEKMKQALLNDEAIILNPTYRGGKITVRDEADFFDVSAALIGPGQEIKKDPKGRKIPYDRKQVTEFGGVKSAQRDKLYKHLQAELGIKNITRTEFNKYAKEQIAAEKDLRKAIKLLNLRSYAANKGIDLSEYPTKEAQLDFLNYINKRKRAKDPKYIDYKETFDYGHIISAKTGFRLEDLGMNRISNTEIESAHNIVSRDPYTQKIIEILQEGNRERGSRRDFIPEVQMMRNTAGTVVEDFVKWKANQPGAKGPNLTKILDKFIPRELHENYLRFVQRRFYEKRQVAGSFKNYLEFEEGIPYERFKKLGRKLQLQLRRAYEKEVAEAGIVIGRQQYDQAYQWMREAIDEFIGLHHLDKAKRIRGPKEAGALYDIEDLMPRDIETLLDMILPDSIND
jgi:hypothetical protein